MKPPHFILLLIILQTLHHLPVILAVKYVAINDAKNYPGGKRFEKEIGIPYTLQIMKDINHYIWEIFQQKIESDRKQVGIATVFIRQYDGAEAITYGETVNVSALYLQGYQGNLKWEYTSLLHHELTHVFQWDGKGQAPVGLIEGMADYMILGYDFTARFLEYCEGLEPGFVAALSKKMRHNFSENFFVELLGKPVAQLWSEYKAKYGNIK
ncbi:hypothetical protein AAHA92_06840 [Salvia divinorum]|uniref:Uncharacterized protein n=1 Tax=Salvia divinorum TaxID=28513 RepID=A0ABD1I711_SALDI